MTNTGVRYTLLIHGGTVTNPESVTPDQLLLLRQIATGGGAQLAAGATALDVVVQAITRMEDSGLFDAGKGSYLNQAGFAETDASLMDGFTGRAGAVAVMQRIKNPIQAARLVMEQTPHVFFAGPEGERVLIGLGAVAVDDPGRYFVPVDQEAARPATEGTVGAVALDRHGNLAAGTSTGGTRGKLPGRVSDSCIIGASTFANDRFALSATGKGEYFIRRTATHAIAMSAGLINMSLKDATNHMVHDLIGGTDLASGAIIAISHDGEIVISSNVYGILHAYTTESIAPTSGAIEPVRPR